jgi:large subunit ribosomal protein L18
MRPEKKNKLAQLRRWRIRNKLSGSRERPRMSVRFTGQHIYVQFIDDEAGVTLASTSTRSKALEDRKQLKANVDSAKRIGSVAAQAAQSAGIKTIVFDRAGARYHGKVKALADAAREAGLQF